MAKGVGERSGMIMGWRKQRDSAQEVHVRMREVDTDKCDNWTRMQCVSCSGKYILYALEYCLPSDTNQQTSWLPQSVLQTEGKKQKLKESIEC